MDTLAARPSQGFPKWLLALCSVSLLAVVLVYHNAPVGELVYDDASLLKFECNDSLADYSFSGACTYRPLRHLSYAAEGSLFGPGSTKARHIVNLTLHWFNIILVGLIGLIVFTKRGRWLSLVVACAFALHPANVDAVAYISGRRDLLCAFFIFSGLLTYFWTRRRETLTAKLVGGAATLLCFVLAIGSKELGVVLAGLVVAFDFRDFRPPDIDRITERAALWLRNRAGVLLPLLLAAAAFVLYRGIIDPVSFIARADSWWGGSVWTNILTSIGVQSHFAEVVLIPIRLPSDWSSPMTSPVVALHDLRLWLALLFLAGMALLATWLNSRGRPEGPLALAWYGVTVLPMSHIIPHHELFAEHYAYLPMVGILFLVVTSTDELLSHLSAPATRRLIAIVLLSVALGALGVRAYVHVDDYESDLTLANNTLAWAPDSGRALIRGANWLVENNRREEARSYYLAAVERDVLPKYDRIAHEELALITLEGGNLQRVRDIVAQGLDRHPGSETLRGIELHLRCQKEDPLACDQLLDIAQGRELRADILLFSALAAYRLGEPHRAVDILDRAIERQPENVSLSGARTKIQRTME